MSNYSSRSAPIIAAVAIALLLTACANTNSVDANPIHEISRDDLLLADLKYSRGALTYISGQERGICSSYTLISTIKS